jgi:hypothetical protein
MYKEKSAMYVQEDLSTNKRKSVLKEKKKSSGNEQEKSANEEQKSALKMEKERGKKRKLKKKDKYSSYCRFQSETRRYRHLLIPFFR